MPSYQRVLAPMWQPIHVRKKETHLLLFFLPFCSAWKPTRAPSTPSRRLFTFIKCTDRHYQKKPDPALLDPYLPSETQGLGNLTDMVTSYQSCCPDSQIVLLGYSQGAQVTADFLCGRSSTGFPATPAYASSVADAVSAIVLMGDPTFVKNENWDRGNATNVSVCLKKKKISFLLSPAPH